MVCKDCERVDREREVYLKFIEDLFDRLGKITGITLEKLLGYPLPTDPCRSELNTVYLGFERILKEKM